MMELPSVKDAVVVAPSECDIYNLIGDHSQNMREEPYKWGKA